MPVVNDLHVEILQSRVPNELAAQVGPKPGPVPLRAAGRMDADKCAAAPDVVLEDLFLSLGIEDLVVRIRKDQDIERENPIGCKNGSVIRVLNRPVVLRADAFEAGDAGGDVLMNVAAAILRVDQDVLAGRSCGAILNSDETPINTYRVIGELERNLDKVNSIVTHDAGAPRDTIMPFYTSTVPHSYIGWGKTTHLGYGIPLMIGAKLANPDKFCLNFMGDGAFGMSGLTLSN